MKTEEELQVQFNKLNVQSHFGAFYEGYRFGQEEVTELKRENKRLNNSLDAWQNRAALNGDLAFKAQSGTGVLGKKFEILKTALEKIKKVVGTSTLQWHVANTALLDAEKLDKK